MPKNTEFPNNKTLKIYMGLIESIISSEGNLSIRELSTMLKLPKSTVHRYLKSLLGCKLIEIDYNGNYVAGLELYRISSMVLTKVNIRSVAIPYMKELVASINETAYLCMYEDGQVVFIDAIECNHNLRHFIEIGKVLRINPFSATGKAIIAFLPEEEVKRVWREAHQTSGFIMYNEEIKKVREKGFAHSVGVRVPGVCGIASPLFNEKKVIGALDITIPESRFQKNMLDQIGLLVKEYALKISLKMGYCNIPLFMEQECINEK